MYFNTKIIVKELYHVEFIYNISSRAYIISLVGRRARQQSCITTAYTTVALCWAYVKYYTHSAQDIRIYQCIYGYILLPGCCYI